MSVRFVCPSCWNVAEMGDDAAGRQVRCPQCHALGKAPKPEPPITRAAPNPAAAAGAGGSGDGARASLPAGIFYRKGGVEVTAARVVIGAQTFQLRNISSVEVREEPNPRVGLIVAGVGLTALGLMMAAAALGSMPELLAVGAVIAAVGVALLLIGRSMDTWYVLVINSTSREFRTWRSEQRAEVAELAAALNRAMEAAGAAA